MAGRQTPSGFEAGSYRESAKENAKRLVPWTDRAANYIGPPDPEDTGMFPEDRTRLGRLKRDLRVIPIAIDTEEAAGIRQRELSRQGKGTGKTQQQRMTEMLREERANAKKLGLTNPTPQVLQAVRVKAAIDTRIDALERGQKKREDTQVPEGKQFKLTPKQRTAAVLDAVSDAYPGFNYGEAKAYLDSLQTTSEIESYLGEVRRLAYGDVLRDWHTRANAASR